MTNLYRNPLEIAKNVSVSGKTKGSHSLPRLISMGFLGGAYIAFAGFFATVVGQDSATYVGAGITKLLMGLAFSVGLMMVVIAGGELFTGNCLMPLGVWTGQVSWKNVGRNWAGIYLTNFLGALVVALFLYYGGLCEGLVGVKALKIAAGKMGLSFTRAFCRGVLCNWIVALSVWMSMAAMDVGGKILAMLFPITAFVASGFEHSVANMYFLSMGLLLKGHPDVVSAAGLGAEKLAHVSFQGLIHNLVPVTLGNLVGGVLFVAFIYYFAFKDRLDQAS